MTGYAQMVTQFHTLLHFVTLFPLILSPSACVAASIRIQGDSKSHLLSIYAHVTSHCSGACIALEYYADNSKSHFSNTFSYSRSTIAHNLSVYGVLSSVDLLCSFL